MIYKIAVVFFMLFFILPSGPANAAYTAPATIEGYDIGSHGKLIIRLSVPNSCNPSNQLFFVSNTEPYYQSMLSMVMAAHLAKQEIQVWAGGCDSGGMEKIVRILVGRVW